MQHWRRFWSQYTSETCLGSWRSRPKPKGFGIEWLHNSLTFRNRIGLDRSPSSGIMYRVTTSQAAHKCLNSWRFGTGSAAYSAALCGKAMVGFARTCKSAAISIYAAHTCLKVSSRALCRSWVKWTSGEVEAEYLIKVCDAATDGLCLLDGAMKDI